MSAELDRLMSNARIHLPGALDSAIQFELFNTLDEFLRLSDVWQEEIEFSVQTDETEYELIPADFGVIDKLMGVVNSDDVPVAADMATPGTLVLQTAPSQAATYTATVSKTVVDPTTRGGDPQFPEWVLTKYRAGILDGVLSRMMAQPAKPYSSERLAIFHGRRFRSAIAQARADARHKNLYGAQRWRFPSFA